MSYFSFASKVKWSLRKKKKNTQNPSNLLESLEEKSNVAHLQIRPCKIAWLLENPLGYQTLENIFQCNAITWGGWTTETLKSWKQDTLLALPPEKELLVGGKKYITLQLSNTRQLLESSSPKLFFFFSKSKMNAISSQSTNGLFFFFHNFSRPPPEIWSKGLQRLQEPLHAITSQTRRWQLRQGLMQSDIIECGLERSSCLQPLLIVAVIR